MDRLLAPNENIAKCVGLWLAEGDNKTKSEITFTNNCWDLVNLFYRTINKIFYKHNYNPRIYVYSKDKKKVKIHYKNCVVKYYVHKKAIKPFFILRFASVEMVKEWKKIVKFFLDKKEFFPNILKGFFAGEGNVHVGRKSVRVLRVSQKERKKFIDDLLNSLNISFSFETGNRNYVITKKFNWDVFAKLKLADLHPLKKEKFWRVYNDFKQEHYEKHYLIKKIYTILEKPLTTRDLSNKFKRSFARTQDVLVLLKKQRRVHNFRVGSIDYWTNDKNLIIISKLKKGYLLFLDRPKQTAELAKKFNVCWKASFRRLKELEKLNLIRRNKKDGKWIKLPVKKSILAI